MTTLTVQVDEEVLERTRALADAKRASVDEVVSDALKAATGFVRAAGEGGDSAEERVRRWEAMMAELAHIDSGGPYTRDEMNER